MALTLSDVTSPTGDLDRTELFPGDDVSTFNNRVGSWLETAATLTAGIPWPDRQDDAGRAYVYWQAYEAVARRMEVTPASVTNPDQQGGWAYTAAQLTAMQNRAARWEAKYLGILASVPSPVLEPVQVPAPFSVPVRRHF